MKKKQDWILLFDQFIQKYYDKPFEWAKWDCCMFSDAYIKTMTGESLIPKALKWTDEESALKTIREYGKNLNGSIKKAAQAKKLEKIDPNFMQKGDLCVIKQETQLCGISDGHKILGPSESGISRIEYKEILAVWRIPNV